MSLESFLTPKIRIHNEEIDVNRGARWLIMSSYLYYQRSCNVLSDGDYDKLSNFVADNWDELTEQLKWQLNSPEDIRATGNGIKITQMGESAALTWYKKTPEGHNIPAQEWKGPDPKFGCKYYVISG